LITLLEDFTVQIVLAGGSQISLDGDEREAKERGQKGRGRGPRIQNSIRTVKRI